jgi:hypothetical protein
MGLNLAILPRISACTSIGSKESIVINKAAHCDTFDAFVSGGLVCWLCHPTRTVVF